MSAPNGVCVFFFFAASKKSGNDRNILRISNFKIAFIITNVVLVIWSRHTKQIGLPSSDLLGPFAFAICLITRMIRDRIELH